MPFNTDKRRQEAQKRPRDRDGHFIPLKPKTKVSGSANLLADLIKTEDGDDKDSSWINLTINHPFRKIIEILDEIRKKQATTVNMKFTIPLIVLPVVLLAAFTLGRWQTGCSDYFSSQVGTLQNVTITRSYPPENRFLQLLSYLPYLNDTFYTEETLVQPVLVNEDQQGIILNNEGGADLGPFTQSKIIAFGTYNSCTKTLTLTSPQNLSNY